LAAISPLPLARDPTEAEVRNRLPLPSPLFGKKTTMIGGDQLYLFQLGSSGRYALSTDPTGCNIPISNLRSPWLLRGTFPEAIDLPEFDEPVREVARHGYCFLLVTPDGRQQ